MFLFVLPLLDPFLSVGIFGAAAMQQVATVACCYSWTLLIGVDKLELMTWSPPYVTSTSGFLFIENLVQGSLVQL